MKRLPFVGVMMLVFILVTGCDTGDNEQDFVAVDAHYELLIINDTEEEVEVYFKDAVPNSNFERRAVVSPGEEMGISNLRITLTYVVRAAPIATSVEDFFFEEQVMRNSPLDYTVRIIHY